VQITDFTMEGILVLKFSEEVSIENPGILNYTLELLFLSKEDKEEKDIKVERLDYISDSAD